MPSAPIRSSRVRAQLVLFGEGQLADRSLRTRRPLSTQVGGPLVGEPGRLVPTHSCMSRSRSAIAWAEVSCPSAPCTPGWRSPIGPAPRRATPPPMETRSFIRVVMAMRHPSPSPPRRSTSGMRASVKNTSLNSASPVIWCSGRTSTPGRVHVDQEAGDALVLGDLGVGAGEEQARSRQWATVVQTFWPLTTHSSPSRTARVARLATSEPAPGSLNSWHQISSPVNRGRRYRFFCSSVPWTPWWGHHPVADDVADRRRRGTAAISWAFARVRGPRRQAEPALALGEVHPGQSPVELLAEERLRRTVLGRASANSWSTSLSTSASLCTSLTRHVGRRHVFVPPRAGYGLELRTWAGAGLWPSSPVGQSRTDQGG